MSLTPLKKEVPGQPGRLKEIASLAGYPLHDCNHSQLMSLLIERMHAGDKSLIFFANSNFVVKCLDIRQEFHASDVVVLNDGVAVETASRVINGHHFEANMNGTDLIPYLLHNAPRGFRIFLYGAQADVVARAATVYERMGHTVVGFCDGYTHSNDQVRRAIEESAAEWVLVALGNPIQEKWILRNARSLSPQVFIGVGALFDFTAGAVRRAPLWVRRVRLEWLYRLLQEPKRLVRRYSIDMLRFFAICWRDRHLGLRAQTNGR